MKKIVLMVIFSLVSFLFIKTSTYAAVESICNYSYSNGSKSYRAIVKITDDGYVKDAKITGKDENSNMVPTNDEDILNWYYKKMTVDTSFWKAWDFKFSYTGKEKYLINKECLGYLIYVYTGIEYHILVFETKEDAEQVVDLFKEAFTSKKRVIEILPLEVIQKPITCNYYASDSKNYKATVVISPEGKINSSKVTSKDEGPNTTPSHKAKIENWDSQVAKVRQTGRVEDFDTKYFGKTEFLKTRKCPNYFIYAYDGYDYDFMLTSDPSYLVKQLDFTYGGNNSKKIVEALSLDKPTSSQTGETKTNNPGTSSNPVVSNSGNSNGTINQDVKDDCEGIFGKDSETKKLLQKVLNIFRILAPILTLIFSSMDFLKAVAAGAKDDLKAAGTKLLKRLIVVALLFFVPTIINILLDIMENSNGTCGIS